MEVRVSTREALAGECVEVTLPGEEAPLVKALGRALLSQTKCTSEYTLTEVKGGFDVDLKVHNPTSKPQKRPTFRLYGIRMGTDFTLLDARSAGHLHRAELRPAEALIDGERQGGFLDMHRAYPDGDGEGMYSPVAAVFNERFAVGVSVIYNPFKLKHCVDLHYWSDRKDLLGTVMIGADLYRPPPGYQERWDRTLIDPGATDDYRITVRFARPGNWLDTLEPYREFFRSRYGGVQYEADLRPIFGMVSTASSGNPEESNPRGYQSGMRLDLDGWKPCVNTIEKEGVSKGYRRTMIWTPIGMYRIGRNYAPEFMTAWPEKLVETLPELLKLKEKGVSIGMWWGRANQVSAGWNTGSMWIRDPEDGDDAEAAWRELRLAVERGTDEVGLDAWKLMPLWDRYDFLKQMLRDFPSLRFSHEQGDCDIVHTIAACYFYWRVQSWPPVLADWLNPGHETWIQLGQSEHKHFDQCVEWKLVPLTTVRGVKHDPSLFEGGN